jgi:hypothetical protein
MCPPEFFRVLLGRAYHRLINNILHYGRSPEPSNVTWYIRQCSEAFQVDGPIRLWILPSDGPL